MIISTSPMLSICVCQVSCGDTFKAEPPQLVRTDTCSMACAGNTSAEGNITKTRRGDVDPFEKNRDFDVVLACAREIGGAVNGTS